MSQTTIDDSNNPESGREEIEREARNWVMRFTSGAGTREDLKASQNWCERSAAHAEAFARACHLWESLGPDVFDTAACPRRGIGVQVTRRVVLGGAAAASLASAAYLVVWPPFGLWPSWSELAADYRTGTGERRRVNLAGGASVEMNTQTSLIVERSRSGGSQLKLISGEATVSIVSGAPEAVVVSAGDGWVRASDAKFNMRRAGDLVCVTCLEGSICVAQGRVTATLRSRQQVVYDGRGVGRITPVDPSVVTAWQQGLLIFHAVPLRSVIAEVNRYRPGRIVLLNAALGRRLFSADFHIKNIGAIIPEIHLLFGAKVTSLPGGIVLLS
jgi:transmembrane sensor